MYLLDTNVVSELRKASGGRAAQSLTQWAVAVPAGSMYVSAITIFELEMGILLSERRDPTQGAVLRAWLQQSVLPAFSNRVLNIDTTVALRCAGLHIPDPRSDRDAFIAATALVHGLTLVTRNVADFRATGVAILNPWEALP